MGQKFTARTHRRIKASVLKSERAIRRLEKSRYGSLSIIEGLLTGDLGEPASFGGLATAELQVWTRNVETDSLEKLIRNGEQLTVTVVNRYPGETYEAGTGVIAIMLGGEWRLLGASCEAFPDDL